MTDIMLKLLTEQQNKIIASNTHAFVTDDSVIYLQERRVVNTSAVSAEASA